GARRSAPAVGPPAPTRARPRAPDGPATRSNNPPSRPAHWRGRGEYHGQTTRPRPARPPAAPSTLTARAHPTAPAEPRRRTTTHTPLPPARSAPAPPGRPRWPPDRGTHPQPVRAGSRPSLSPAPPGRNRSAAPPRPAQ